MRYQGIFGPVSVGAYGFYEHAAVEHVAAAFRPVVSAAGAAPGRDPANTYDPLSWYEFAVYGRLATGVGTFTGSMAYVGGAISSGTLLLLT